VTEDGANLMMMLFPAAPSKRLSITILEELMKKVKFDEEIVIFER
jgi:hypothetical protein